MSTESNASLINQADLGIAKADDAVGCMKAPRKGAVPVAEAADCVPDLSEAVKDVYETWEGVVERIKWLMDLVDGIAEVHAMSNSFRICDNFVRHVGPSVC